MTDRNEGFELRGYGQGDTGVPLRLEPIPTEALEVARGLLVGNVERRLRRRSVVGLLGPEGTGKRTIGQLLAGRGGYGSAWSLSLEKCDGEDVAGALTCALGILDGFGPGQNLLVVGAFPFMDEESAYEAAQAIDAGRGHGSHVLLCMGWEAEVLAEALGEDTLSVHDGPVVGRGATTEWICGTPWDTKGAMEATAGIAGLLASLDGTGELGEGYDRELSRLLMAAVRSTPMEQDRRLRATLVLMGEGTLADLEEVCGLKHHRSLAFELLGEAARQEPILGIHGTEFSRAGRGRGVEKVLAWAMEYHSDLVISLMEWGCNHGRWAWLAWLLSLRSDLPVAPEFWEYVGELTDAGARGSLAAMADEKTPEAAGRFLESVGAWFGTAAAEGSEVAPGGHRTALRADGTIGRGGPWAAGNADDADGPTPLGGLLEAETALWAFGLGYEKAPPEGGFPGPYRDDHRWRLRLHGSLLATPADPRLRKLLVEALERGSGETLTGAILGLLAARLGLQGSEEAKALAIPFRGLLASYGASGPMGVAGIGPGPRWIPAVGAPKGDEEDGPRAPAVVGPAGGGPGLDGDGAAAALSIAGDGGGPDIAYPGTAGPTQLRLWEGGHGPAPGSTVAMTHDLGSTMTMAPAPGVPGLQTTPSGPDSPPPTSVQGDFFAAPCPEDLEPLSVRALGSLRISLGGKVLTTMEVERRSAFSLLGLLAFARDHELPRERILSLLWPEVDERLARNRLYAAMSALRKALGGRGRCERYLMARRGMVGLVPGAVRCDVDEAESLCRRILSGSSDDGEVASMASELLGLFDGGELEGRPEMDDEFGARRFHLLRRCVDALVVGAEAALSLGEAERASAIARECFRADKGREDVCDVLLRALAAEGRYPEADKVFSAHAEACLALVDLPPTRRIRALYRSIAQGHPRPRVRLGSVAAGPAGNPLTLEGPVQRTLTFAVEDAGE